MATLTKQYPVLTDDFKDLCHELEWTFPKEFFNVVWLLLHCLSKLLLPVE